MTLTYWEEQAKKELESAGDCEAISQISAPSVNTEIIDLNAVKSDIEIKKQNDLEVEEFFAEEEKKNSKSKSVGRLIFLDGLLGVPFLCFMYLLISVFVVLTVTAAILFAGGTLALIALCIYTMVNAFGNIISNTGDSVVIIGCCMAGLGLAGLLFILSSFLFVKAIPFACGLYGKFFRKLNLF